MKRLSLPTFLLVVLLAACGTGPTGEGSIGDRCTVHLRPGDDDQTAIQSALIEAFPGSVICFDEGTYRLTDGLSVGVPGITLRSTRGTGGKAILDFSGQVADAPGLDVTGDDVAVDGLELRNTAGDALRLVQGDNVRIRRVRIGWASDAPPVADARGISVLGASNVVVEACTIVGAAAEGILVASSDGVTIRSSSVRDSGGGIAIESSSFVETVNNRLRNNGPPAFEAPGEVVPAADEFEAR